MMKDRGEDKSVNGVFPAARVGRRPACRSASRVGVIRSAESPVLPAGACHFNAACHRAAGHASGGCVGQRDDLDVQRKFLQGLRQGAGFCRIPGPFVSGKGWAHPR